MTASSPRTQFLEARVLAIVVLAACAPERRAAVPQPAEPTAPVQEIAAPEPARNVPRGRATVQVLTEPTSLDTLVASQSAATNLLSDHVYESLVSADPAETERFVARPALAESWTISADGRTQTFALRRGVTWHDGRPFTSLDVLATLHRARDAASGAHEFRAYLDELESYRAPDAHTIVLVWKTPYFMILPVLSLLPMQPAHAVASLARSPVGTGPWRFVEWVEGERLVLAASPQHWGPGPHLEQIEFRFVRDRATVGRLLAQGEIDVVTEFADELAPIAEQHGFQRIEAAENRMAWLGWNNERRLFRDARVRRAMAHAIDWERAAREAGGTLPRRTCFFVPRPGAPDNPCDDAAGPLPYSESEAVRLLAEAGWTHQRAALRDANGAPFHFEVLTTEVMAGSPALRVLGEALSRLGVVMGVHPLSWPTLVERLRAGTFDACMLTWSEPILESDPTQVFHSDHAGGDNLVRFRNSAADDLMERARRMPDPVERGALFRALTLILRDEQPVTLLDAMRRVALVSPRLSEVRPTTRGWRYEDWRLTAE